MMSLKGQFLVAMPDMADERFHEAVIYLVGHGEDGAMGLVVNQGIEDMKFIDILEELDIFPGHDDGPQAAAGRRDFIRIPERVRNGTVLRGGPVQRGRGFVLHSPDYFREGNSYSVNDDICLTATLDVLKAMAFGKRPADAIFALGYCGWSPGQLEEEIRGNGWLTVPFSRELLFSTPLVRRYDAALETLGITRASLSLLSGHA